MGRTDLSRTVTVNEGTVVVLSPYPSEKKFPKFSGNTNTEIVFNFLKFMERNNSNDETLLSQIYSNSSEKLNKEVFTVESVTTGTFEIDTLLALFVLINPSFALKHKRLLLEVATISRFQRCESYAAQDAFRVLFVP